MTLQEIYTKVRNHLLKQGERAQDNSIDGNPCVYLSPTGLKCAVGCLIPTEKYHPDLEMKLVTTPAVAKAAGLEFELMSDGLNGEYATGPQISLCVALQSIHDNDPVGVWEPYLNSCAEVFNLIVEG